MPRIDRCVLVSEEAIHEGFRWCLQNHQYLIESTAAVVIGAALSGQLKSIQGPAIFVLSGRNVSYETMKTLLI